MRKVSFAVLLGLTVGVLVGVSPAFGDRVEGTAGDDVLRGTGEHDRVFGFAGNDRAFGRGGRDIVRGGRGDDRVFGGTNLDGVFGGDGDDVLNGGLGGNDGLWGGPGADVLRGGRGKGPDYMTGGPGEDTLFLGPWVEQVEGNRGNDKVRLIEDGRPDFVNCGAGRDVVTIAGAREPNDIIRPNCERIV